MTRYTLTATATDKHGVPMSIELTGLTGREVRKYRTQMATKGIVPIVSKQK